MCWNVQKSYIFAHIKTKKMKNTTLTREVIIASYNQKMAELQEREDYRFQNYYNCVDDYSFGSPIHAAVDSSTRRRAEKCRDYALETLEFGFCTIVSLQSLLLNEAGEICAEGTGYGKFGSYFRLFNGGFVGVPKKASTLEAKGYTMQERKTTYKARFTGGFTKNDDAIFDEISIIKQEFTPSLTAYGNSIIDWLYKNQTGA
jgi:hypothetical protein